MVYQDLLRITRAIEDGSFEQNEAFVKLVNRLKRDGKALHLMGLLSDGGVHSHQNHLYALLKWQKMPDWKRFMYMPLWMVVTFLNLWDWLFGTASSKV